VNQQELTDLATDLRAYVCGSRDSKREVALLRRIRAFPQAMRLQILAPLLDLNATVSLVLVDRAQLSRAAYLAILQRGLDKADASSIYEWMAATVSHLGWRKVFAVLRQTLSTNPRRGASALYHAGGMVWGNPASHTLSGSLPADALDEFCQLVELYHRNGQVVCPDAQEFQLIRDRARSTPRSPQGLR
jgi:hypothetical protein